MKENRKGIALPIALMAGGIFIFAIMSLSFYSNQELGSVRKFISIKKSEFLAYTGIQWVESKLHKNRWYQPDGNQFSNSSGIWKTCHSEEVIPFQNDTSLKARIYIDEIPSKQKFDYVKNKKLYKVSALSHLKILSTANVNKQKSIYYGKFIFSPEPVLNSNSVDGIEKLMGTGNSNHTIKCEAKVPGKKVLIVEKIFRSNFAINKRVEKGTVLCKLNVPGGKGLGSIASGIVVADYSGIIKKIFIKEGKIVKTGAPLFLLKKEGSFPKASMTLRKMVRITKIPRSVYSKLDLTIKEDRQKIYSFVDKNTNQYVKNYANVEDKAEGILEAFLVSKDIERLSDKEAISKLESSSSKQPSLNELEAKKRFLVDMLKNFCPPEITDPETIELFKETSNFYLDPKKKTIKPVKNNSDVINIVKGLKHGRNYLDPDPLAMREYEKTKGKINLYKITSAKQYIDYLKKYSSMHHPAFRPHKKDELRNFLEHFSQLPAAVREVEIDAKPGTYLNIFHYMHFDKFIDLRNSGNLPKELEAFKEIPDGVSQKDYFEVKLSNHHNVTNPKRYFYKYEKSVEFRVYVESRLNPTYYYMFNENKDISKRLGGKEFKFRVDYLLEFFLKYFDEGLENLEIPTVRAADKPTENPADGDPGFDSFGTCGSCM
jgi:hypothetical protein